MVSLKKITNSGNERESKNPNAKRKEQIKRRENLHKISNNNRNRIF